MNRKPPELHIIDGTKSKTGNSNLLPSSIKKRIPRAEWLEHPEAFDKLKFIDETSDFLFEMYGIGSDQDKHTLGILADHVETYVRCTIALKKTGLVTNFNNGQTVGPSPYLSVRNKTTSLIIQLMNELGLTPRGRLSQAKPEENSAVAKFLRGPMAQ